MGDDEGVVQGEGEAYINSFRKGVKIAQERNIAANPTYTDYLMGLIEATHFNIGEV